MTASCGNNEAKALAAIHPLYALTYALCTKCMEPELQDRGLCRTLHSGDSWQGLR